CYLIHSPHLTTHSYTLSLHDALPISADTLLLTKPVGGGIITTAIKKDLLTTKQIDQASQVMSTLNKYAAESLTHFHPHAVTDIRSEEHTSELQSRFDLVCRLLLEKKK